MLRTARRVGALTMMGLLVLAGGCGSTAATSATHTAPSAAPGPAAAPPQSQGPSAATAVKIQLSFLVQGWADPYILAKENGYYRQVGIDAQISEGTGSTVAAEVVGNGQAQFGVMEAGSAAIAISKGVPLKIVAVFLRDTPEAFIHDPDFQIKSPKDLIGHPIISTAGSAPLQILPAALGRYGVRMDQLTFDLVNARSEVPAFLHTKGAVLIGPATGSYPAVLQQDPKAVADLFSQFGVHMYNSCLVTSLSEMRQHPDTVRKVVAASVLGWQAAARDPAAAAAAAVKEFPKQDKAVQQAGVQQAVKLFYSPNTQGKPLGWMSADDWRQTLDLLHQYAGMNPVKPLDTYYTNEFLPQS